MACGQCDRRQPAWENGLDGLRPELRHSPLRTRWSRSHFTHPSPALASRALDTPCAGSARARRSGGAPLKTAEKVVRATDASARGPHRSLETFHRPLPLKSGRAPNRLICRAGCVATDGSSCARIRRSGSGSCAFRWRTVVGRATSRAAALASDARVVRPARYRWQCRARRGRAATGQRGLLVRGLVFALWIPLD